MNNTVVGILWGGPSSEHDVSLATGNTMRANLSPDKYDVRDIYIDRAGVWHERGMPLSPEQALQTLDVALVGLHGAYGEDGEVQKMLERFGIPYAGSNSFASFLASHKALAKEKIKEAGILTPKYKLIEQGDSVEEVASEIVRTFSQPVIVKPVNGGSSRGVSLTHGYAPLISMVSNLFALGAPAVLVEEFIKGREASVGVVEGMRGEDHYTMPPVEISHASEEKFYTDEARRIDSSRKMCPAPMTPDIKQALIDAARSAHKVLGLRDYSSHDFIVSPRGVYYLESDSLPSLAETSLFSHGMNAVGIPKSDLLSHLIERAITRHD